jgi:hypothetical protein
MIPIPKVKAKVCKAQVPKINIDIITNNVDKEVNIDLLIVCHKLFSNTSHKLSYSFHHNLP